jgi:hypothetical protein
MPVSTSYRCEVPAARPQVQTCVRPCSSPSLSAFLRQLSPPSFVFSGVFWRPRTTYTVWVFAHSCCFLAKRPCFGLLDPVRGVCVASARGDPPSNALAMCSPPHPRGRAVALTPVPSFDTVRRWQAQGVFDADGNFVNAPDDSGSDSQAGGGGLPNNGDPYQTCGSGAGTGAGGDSLDNAQCVALTIDLLGGCLCKALSCLLGGLK